MLFVDWGFISLFGGLVFCTGANVSLLFFGGGVSFSFSFSFLAKRGDFSR